MGGERRVNHKIVQYQLAYRKLTPLINGWQNCLNIKQFLISHF